MIKLLNKIGLFTRKQLHNVVMVTYLKTYNKKAVHSAINTHLRDKIAAEALLAFIRDLDMENDAEDIENIELFVDSVLDED